MKHHDRAELFLFSTEIIKFSETNEKEILSTYDNMIQMNIANMPYSLVDIGVNAQIHKFQNEDIKDVAFYLDNNPDDDSTSAEIRFRYKDNKSTDILVRITREWHDVHALVSVKAPEDVKKYCSIYHTWAEMYRRTLIVLLATKDVIKTRTKDKLLAIGIGKKRLRDNMCPIYTTTLSLPTRCLSRERGLGGTAGLTLRPHLRRGHVRDQRYGPKLEFVKEIWIEPCLVNADENFVSQRSSYNTSIKNGDQP